jgi:hypothetical protein
MNNESRVIDLFPATLTHPSGAFHRKVRAVYELDGGRLRVWAEGAGGREVVEVFSGLGALNERPDVRMVRRRQRLRILTAEGEFIINGQVGCGCGSPLKALSV